MAGLTCVLFLSVLFYINFPCYIYGYRITLDTNEISCFIHRVDKTPIKIKFSFEVTDGGFMDIGASASNPKREILWESFKKSSDSLILNAHDVGDYTFCMNNTMSTATTKEVMFDIQAEEPEEVSNSSSLELTLKQLNIKLWNIKREQEYMNARSVANHKIGEETNHRVGIWSIIEAFINGGACMMQIYFCKRWFDHRVTA